MTSGEAGGMAAAERLQAAELYGLHFQPTYQGNTLVSRRLFHYVLIHHADSKSGWDNLG